MEKNYNLSSTDKKITLRGLRTSVTTIMLALLVFGTVQAQEPVGINFDGAVEYIPGESISQETANTGTGVFIVPVLTEQKNGATIPSKLHKSGGTKSVNGCTEKIFGGDDEYYYCSDDTEELSVTHTFYNYTHTQFIIKRAELADYVGTCGMAIYKIYFHLCLTYGDAGTAFTRNWSISMGHTNTNQYSSNILGNGTYLTGLTQVFSGNVTFSSDGWYAITLTTPFVYNGTQNLVIDVKDNTGSYLTSSYRPVFSCVSQPALVLIRHSDNSNNNSQTSGPREDYRPYCGLCISPRSNLTYNTNGNGNCSSGTTITGANCVDAVTLPSTAPSCGGGTFVFWSQHPDGYGEQYGPGDVVEMPTTDVTLYAIYHGTLTYNTTANCLGGGTATTIDPVEDRQVAHVTSVIPTCSTSGSFRYWNTAADGSGTTYEAGDEIRLDCLGDVTLYAIYCDEPYHVSINGCNRQPGDPEDEPCYIDVCLNTPGAHNVTLTASSDMPSPTYRWSVNRHDGNGYTYTTGNNQTVNITGTDLIGFDVQVTAQSPEGCKATLNGRIRTSNGLHAEVPSTLPHICAGSGRTLTIGTVGTDIIIDEPAVHIEANLGQGVQTFIPDGPNCTALGQCYTSQVEFVDFDPDAVVDLASDINYLRINLEHSHIGDMQIKLICPNGQSSIILEDSYGIANGGLDEYQYDWMYTNILFWAQYKVYTNTAGDGGCSQGAYQGTADMRTYVVYNGSTYSTTGVRQEATGFPMSSSVSTLLSHLRAARNSGNTPASFCKGDYYYVFDSWRQTATDFTTSTFDNNGLSDYLVHWGLDNASLGFGMPNPLDGLLSGDECDEAHNNEGAGLDYCWSNNPDYSYAGGAHGWVRETANHQYGTTIGNVVIPSNMDNMTQIYHPFQDFSNLLGCPLNGTWTVQVCDSWALDNGYIFDWSLALSDDKLPNAWSYSIVTAGSELNCETGSITHTVNPIDYSIEIDPQPGESGTGCTITITDNIGCETTVDLPLVIDESHITPASSNQNTIEVCQGIGIATGNSWTIGGIATGATIAWAPSAPAGVQFNVSGTTVTLGGSNVTAAPNTYNYTISTVQSSDCEPAIATGTVVVNPKPVVSVAALTNNECPNGQSVTVTGSMPTAGTDPYNYTWNIGSLTVASGSSTTIIGSTSTAPTVNVIIPTSPCSANYPIGLSVTDAKGCSYTFSPTNVITVGDNGGPTLIGGASWPADQLGSQEFYPGLTELLTRVPSEATIAALYEDDCTSPVNVTRGTPIQDSSADCGWGVRVPYTISDNCGNSFTNYINLTGGDDNFTTISSKDTIVSCPSQLLTQQQMESLIPEVTACGITRQVYFDSIQDSITASCGKRTYFYHYFDANSTEYIWTFTFHLEHTGIPTELGTPVANTATVACAEQAVLPTVMPEIRDVCGNLIDTPTDTVIEENLDGCNGFRRYKFTYRDCANLDTTWTFTYTIRDTIAPTINTIAQQDALPAANCQYKIPDLRPLATATDNCGGEVTFVSQSPDTNARFAPTSSQRYETVTVTMSDACGNTATRTVQVRIPANTLSVTASNDVSICPGNSTTLTAQSNDATATFMWAPASWLSGNSGSSVTASPNEDITYTVTATNANGCVATDSVLVTINPSVLLSTHDNLNQTVCAGANITPINISFANATVSVSGLPNAVQYNVTGTGVGQIAGHPNATGNFTVTATSPYGCPGDVLHGSIAVNDTLRSEQSTTVCDSYSWPANGTTYTASGRYRWHTTTAASCDSVVYLNLTVNRQTTGVDNVSECDSYTWTRGDGHTYTTSTNAPTHIFRNGNAAGCDSTVTLHLTIHNSVTVETTEHWCDEYVWDGESYTTDADLSQYLQDQWGCDSTVTLHLKIHPSYHFQDSNSVCQGESYEYHGQSFTTDGEHALTFRSAYGCDSVYNLELEVLANLSVSIDTTIDCIHGWYELTFESDAEYHHWTSRAQPHTPSIIAQNRYKDEGYDSVLHATPQVPSIYYITVGYDENLRCPQTDSIAVDEFIVPEAVFDLRPAHVTPDDLQWYADYDAFGAHPGISREWYVDGEYYTQQTQHISGAYDLRSGNDSVIVWLVAHGKQCDDTLKRAIPFYMDNIYVPNVFTPGREFNSLFGPEGTGIIELEMWVHNREGLLVYHSTSLEEKWDGTHNGTDCPMSSYVYRINYKMRSMPKGWQTIVGTVMLIR